MSQLSSSTLILLNQQYSHEKRNQLIYESMASSLDFFGLSGSASFLRKQAEGEGEHAAAVYKFINDRNEHASVVSIDTPTVPDDFFDVFLLAMQVELETTDKLKNIASKAFNENDLQTFFWISDLIKEQTEEENVIRTIIDRFTLCGRESEMIHHYDILIGSL